MGLTRVLRTFVTALLLLTLPLAQARAVVVCSMAPAVPMHDCACPHDHAGMHRHAPAQKSEPRSHDCCKVEFAPVTEPSAVADAKAAEVPVLPAPKGDDGQWLVVPAAIDVLAAPPRAAPARFALHERSSDDSRLYLTTARLRL